MRCGSFFFLMLPLGFVGLASLAGACTSGPAEPPVVINNLPGAQDGDASAQAPTLGDSGGVSTTNPTACVVGGGSCNTGTECCSNRCVDGVCDPCAGPGATCGATACCPNARPTLTCLAGQCTACLGGGATCTKTSDCCSKACTGGTCEAPSSPTECAKEGASCQTTACCAGMPCDQGFCGCNVTTQLQSAFPTLGPTCVAALQSCCVQSKACLASSGCTTYVQCLGACLGDAGCKSNCVAAAAAGATSLYGAVSSCVVANGGGACLP